MDTNKAGSPTGGGYQDQGVGNSSVVAKEVTRKGKFPVDNTGPGRSQGEVSGCGSLYAVMLNERPNCSGTRNRGPERAPSRSAATPVPVIEMNTRNTGKVTGGGSE